mgnify:CR=1 FL=1
MVAQRIVDIFTYDAELAGIINAYARAEEIRGFSYEIDDAKKPDPHCLKDMPLTAGILEIIANNETEVEIKDRNTGNTIELDNYLYLFQFKD